MMIALIDEYRKELLEIATFEEETVQNYTSCLIAYFEYAKKELGIDPIQTEGCHVQNWMETLKRKKLSGSRLQHHRSALKTFFAFLVKMKIIKHNPADTLSLIRKVKSEKNQPISKQVASKLLYSIDQTSWRGKRNFLIIAVLWALGLRLNELTCLKIGDFEVDHAKREKIALLRIRGKNKKQRALFVVDKLYDYMINYLAHPDSKSKKKGKNSVNYVAFTPIRETALPLSPEILFNLIFSKELYISPLTVI
jgi:site-specific recombinase XerD